MNFILEMLSYSFVVKALIVGVLLSVCSALVGTSLVLRQNSMISDGLSHAAFGAFAVAIVLGFAPLWVALPIVIFAAFLILRFNANKKSFGDARIAVLSVSSLAVGTLAISLKKGINIDLNSYLFGSILSVSRLDVWLSILVFIITIVLFVISYNRIFTITFDEEFASSVGIKVKSYDAIFAIICSFIVVLGLRLIGSLLISSLIIFPTLSALQVTKSYKSTIILAVIISISSFLLGMTFSYLLSVPTGAAVVLINLVFLIVAKIYSKL